MTYEVVEGSPKPTERRQLLSRLQQVKAQLPFQHSVLELHPVKFPSFSETLKTKQNCFESPKHIRLSRHDFRPCQVKPWAINLQLHFTAGSQLRAGTLRSVLLPVDTHLHLEDSFNLQGLTVH